MPTAGQISNGGVVERESGFEFDGMDEITNALHNPDFTTARDVSDAINLDLGSNFAAATDPGTVVMRVPQSYPGSVSNLLTDIELLNVKPDMPARAVIDETSGVIVISDKVRLNTVAIAHDNLTIRITETPKVSHFTPEGADTITVDRSGIEINEGEDNRLTVIESGVSLHELVARLNSLGVGPRDMMSILQTVKAAGALQAEIQLM